MGQIKLHFSTSYLNLLCKKIVPAVMITILIIIPTCMSSSLFTNYFAFGTLIRAILVWEILRGFWRLPDQSTAEHSFKWYAGLWPKTKVSAPDDLFKLIYWFTAIANCLFLMFILGWTLFTYLPRLIIINIITSVFWGSVLFILLVREYRLFMASFDLTAENESRKILSK